MSGYDPTTGVSWEQLPLPIAPSDWESEDILVTSPEDDWPTFDWEDDYNPDDRDQDHEDNRQPHEHD